MKCQIKIFHNNDMFDESYYKTGNYTNYLEKKEKYKKLASELFFLFDCLNINNKNIQILDYGCAVGFLLDGIKDLGFNNIYGYDISSWAIEQASKKHQILGSKEIYKKTFDICFILDVLEHMNDKDAEHFLKNIKSKLIVFRIPVSNDGGKKFVLEVSNNDKTHINCKEKNDWENIFFKYGFKKIIKLNLKSIYDSEGVFSGIAFK